MRTVTIFLLLAALSLADAALGATFRDAVLSDRTIDGEAVFAGTVRVRGRVTVSEGSSLRIEPGTVVVFEYVDDDGDGIGESEILSQGAVRVSGTAEAPVVFRSDARKKGGWLGFSVMNVDTVNLFEHAVFEDSYMALHSHFSNIAVRLNASKGRVSPCSRIILARAIQSVSSPCNKWPTTSYGLHAPGPAAPRVHASGSPASSARSTAGVRRRSAIASSDWYSIATS